MPDSSIFDTYHTFDSLFDIYPDKIQTGAVYGYRKSDGTLLKFPCTLDVSRVVRDAKGRWTASGLGLKPVVVKYAYSFERTGAKEAWIGDGFSESESFNRSNVNFNAQKIRFLDDVKSIGKEAFRNCIALTDITIPDSVTEIGDWAFEDCESLTNVTIPEGVTSIGDGAFFCCESLTNVTIPDSVTSVGDQAFDGCFGLTSVTIPDTVTSIGKSAFCDCSNLTSVTIPKGVTEIGCNTFMDCTKLTNVTIPKSVKTIGEDAFKGCRSLTDIYVNQPESTTLFANASVPKGCTIHWDPMTVEQVQNYTLENARELATFAKEHDIYVSGHEVGNVYDLNDDEDNDSIAEIIGDILKCSKSKRVYDYLRKAFEGDARFVWEVNGFLVPFTENDLEQLKAAVLVWNQLFLELNRSSSTF